MPNLNLSNWTWDQIKDEYPDIYRQYGPGTPGFVDPNAPAPIGPPPPATSPGITQAPGLAPTGYDSTFGGIYNVPDPGSTARLAIDANRNNMPAITDLIKSINPNYDAQQGIIGDQLGGNIPADVVRKLSQLGAERGVAIGSPGSQNSMAALLQALGLTSLDMTKSGMDYASRFTDQNYGMARPNFVTPEDMQAAATAQSINNSAPNPRLAAEEALRRLQMGLGDIGPQPGSVGGGPPITPPMGGRPVGAIPPNPPTPRVGPPSYGDRAYGSSVDSGYPAPTMYAPASPFRAGTPQDTVDPSSAAGRRLSDAGYRANTIRGMSREQAAQALGVDPSELDIGGEAGGDTHFLEQPVDPRSAAGTRLQDWGYTWDEIGTLTREEASWILGGDVDDLDVWAPAQEAPTYADPYQQPGAWGAPEGTGYNSWSDSYSRPPDEYGDDAYWDWFNNDPGWGSAPGSNPEPVPIMGGGDDWFSGLFGDIYNEGP